MRDIEVLARAKILNGKHIVMNTCRFVEFSEKYDLNLAEQYLTIDVIRNCRDMYTCVNLIERSHIFEALREDCERLKNELKSYKVDFTFEITLDENSVSGYHYAITIRLYVGSKVEAEWTNEKATDILNALFTEVVNSRAVISL